VWWCDVKGTCEAKNWLNECSPFRRVAGVIVESRIPALQAGRSSRSIIRAEKIRRLQRRCGKQFSNFSKHCDELINELPFEKSSSLLFPYIACVSEYLITPFPYTAREKTQGAIWQSFQVSVAWK
jgi:hypothetical protein